MLHYNLFLSKNVVKLLFISNTTTSATSIPDFNGKWCSVIIIVELHLSFFVALWLMFLLNKTDRYHNTTYKNQTHFE